MTFGPLPFAKIKKNRRKRSGASENWWNPKNVVVPLCRACYRAALAFATFFSLLFFFRICCCFCWFCSIAKHILVTDLFFCSLFRRLSALPAAASSAFCLCSTFANSACCSPTPLLTYSHIVSVFRVNLQVTPRDLYNPTLYKKKSPKNRPKFSSCLPHCACLCVSVRVCARLCILLCLADKNTARQVIKIRGTMKKKKKSN